MTMCLKLQNLPKCNAIESNSAYEIKTIQYHSIMNNGENQRAIKMKMRNKWLKWFSLAFSADTFFTTQS